MWDAESASALQAWGEAQQLAAALQQQAASPPQGREALLVSLLRAEAQPPGEAGRVEEQQAAA